MNIKHIFLLFIAFNSQLNSFGQQFTFENDDLKIKLPNPISDTTYVDKNNLLTRLIYSDSANISYVLTIADFKRDIPSFKQLIRTGFTGGVMSLQEFQAKTISVKDTTIRGFESRIYKLSYYNNDEENIMNSLCFSIQNKFYILQTIYYNDTVSENLLYQRTLNYFDSLILKKDFEPTIPFKAIALISIFIFVIIFCFKVYFKKRNSYR